LKKKKSEWTKVEPGEEGRGGEITGGQSEKVEVCMT